jgi:CheY-like chemotaxis protein
LDILHQHPLPTLLVDDLGCVLDANGPLCSLTGEASADLMGQELDRLLAQPEGGVVAESLLAELKRCGMATGQFDVPGPGVKSQRARVLAWRNTGSKEQFLIHVIPEPAQRASLALRDDVGVELRRLAPLSAEAAREALVAVHALLPHLELTPSVRGALLAVHQALSRMAQAVLKPCELATPAQAGACWTELEGWLDALHEGVVLAPATVEGPVLVVEDVPEVQRNTTRMLIDRGIPAVAVGDGAEALERIMANTGFSAVLLDLNLPKQSGREVLTFLGLIPNAPPVIVFTVEDVAAIEQELLDLGARVVIPKTVSGTELVEVVRAVVSAEATQPVAQPTSAAAAAG